MRISILGPYSSRNFGDHVMLLSLLYIIQKIKPNVKIYVFSSTHKLIKRIISKDNILNICSENIVIIKSKIKFLLFTLIFSNLLIIGGGFL